MTDDKNKIENIIEKEKRLITYEGEDRVVPIDEMKRELEEKGFAKAHKVMSGLTKLDEYINGFEGGELITISGPTKQGKSSFAHTLTKNFEDQGTFSVWFSFEVTINWLIEKFARAKLFYIPRRLKRRSLDWIMDRIIESKLKSNTRAVFIDHLHYIVDMEKSRNMSVEIGTVIRELKSLAVDLNVVIFLMAHMTKTKYDQMPTESDLRDSSFIAQESDKTLIIWRERKKSRGSKQFEFTGKTLLIISNDRRSGVMGKIVELEFKDNSFIEDKSDYDKVVDKAVEENNSNELKIWQD